MQLKERISYFSYCSKLSTFGQSKIGFTYWRAYIQIFQALKRVAAKFSADRLCVRFSYEEKEQAAVGLLSKFNQLRVILIGYAFVSIALHYGFRSSAS